jgi:hypothetical protein
MEFIELNNFEFKNSTSIYNTFIIDNEKFKIVFHSTFSNLYSIYYEKNKNFILKKRNLNLLNKKLCKK